MSSKRVNSKHFWPVVLCATLAASVLSFSSVSNVNAAGTSKIVNDGDPAVSYQGSWNHQFIDPDNYYMQDFHNCNDAGSYAQYTFTGSSIMWISTGNSNQGIADVYIDDVKEASVDCYSPATEHERVVFQKAGLSNGQHTIKIVVSADKNPAATDRQILIDAFAVDAVNDGDSAVSYQGSWSHQYIDPDNYYMTDFHNSNIAEDFAQYTFTGSSVIWISTGNNNQGMADVYIDGVKDATVDCYSPSAEHERVLYQKTGLSNGQHTIKVVVSADKNSAATDRQILIDAFAVDDVNSVPDVVPTTPPDDVWMDDKDPAIVYLGNWTDTTNADFYNTTLKYSNTIGDSIQFVFSGTGFTWRGGTGDSHGSVNVYIDGAYETNVSTYTPTITGPISLYTKTGLPAGNHSVKIQIATAGYQDIDAIVISPSSSSVDNPPSTPEGVWMDDRDGGIMYMGSWTETANADFYKTTLKYSNTIGDSIQFEFNGTGFTWRGGTGDNHGSVNVYIDGTYETTVSTCTPTITGPINLYTKTGLPDGSHTVKIQIASAGYQDIDAIVYQGTPAAAIPRVVSVGDLLDETFIYPTGYGYSGSDVPILSGWDVDRSGGFLESSWPNWFKITDTSSTNGVTLKKRLAGTVSGKLTLEYRFKMPAKMDGVSWQLLDEATVGVNILTSGGNLCYQSASGAAAMQSYNAGQEYGVKVETDINAKLMDIYVDGALKASGVPFANNSVTKFDNIAIKTGDAATGDLYTQPIWIHTGYAAVERFISASVGFTPDDWTLDSSGGAGAVSEWNCDGNYTDKNSYKMTDTSNTAAVGMTKGFPTQTGDTVFEYKFLLPEKADGMTAELRSGGAAAVKIVTDAGNICYVDSSGNPQVLWPSYVKNLWYTIKIQTKSNNRSDIYVNYKLKGANVAFCNTAPVIDGIRFATSAASTGVMWFDDVAVYSVQPEPADYVPAPQPVSHSELIGIQTCALWKEGHHNGWDWIDNNSSIRKPYLGWYNESLPEVADWEINWMVSHGIDFQMQNWIHAPNSSEGAPIKGLFNQWWFDAYFNAKYSNQMKLAIMFDNGNPTGWKDFNDYANNVVPYMVEYYLKDPRYLVINNKPVIMHYSSNPMGTTEINFLKQACVDAGFDGAYILIEYRGTDPNVIKNYINMGYDAVYDYCDAYQAYFESMVRNGITDVVPGPSMGWDLTAWTNPNSSSGNWPTPAQFQSLLSYVKNTYQAGLPVGKLGKNMLLFDDWNEFGEGHFIMPSNLAGFGYLDAIRSVFTTDPPHTDQVPTKAQKARLDTLYSRDWDSN